MPRRRTPPKRNPVAKAVKKLAPKIVPNTRRKKRLRAELREARNADDE